MRVCIFADGCDRAAAQRVLDTLPRDAYGHVFITTDAAEGDAPVMPDLVADLSGVGDFCADGSLAGDSHAAGSVAEGSEVGLLDAALMAEAATVATCPGLAVPERVQVCWLSSRGGMCPLAEAMTGWTAEWLPDDGCTEDTPTVWLLPGASTRLSGLDHDCVTRLITALPSDQLIHG